MAREHATATITCLVSGFWVFSDHVADDTRTLRIVKGLHGLHIYANQFWLEYLLDTVSTSSCLVEDSPLYHAATKLAQSLWTQQNMTMCSSSGVSESATIRDTRLQFLKEHDMIYEMAKIELGARVTRSKMLMVRPTQTTLRILRHIYAGIDK